MGTLQKCVYCDYISVGVISRAFEDIWYCWAVNVALLNICASFFSVVICLSPVRINSATVVGVFNARRLLVATVAASIDEIL